MREQSWSCHFSTKGPRVFSFFSQGSILSRQERDPAASSAGIRILAEDDGGAYRLLLPVGSAQAAHLGSNADGSGSPDGEAIPFIIRRGTQRRTRLAIRVSPGGEVEVLLPWRTGTKEALDAVRRRAEWIARHVREARARPCLEPLRYVPGEMHLYLGRTVALVVAPCGSMAAAGGRDRVRLEGETLRVRMASSQPEHVRAALQAWYRQEASRVFSERLDLLCAGITWLQARPPLRLRAMRRRWGSCTRQGLLTLNTHLVKAPVHCIDYVLLHEIAHLRELNHSKHYYAVLEQLLPGWKAVRAELERRAPALLVR